MANPWRGEVEITLDGVAHPAKLTLAALVELEAGLDCQSLVALTSRFEAGTVSGRDILALIVAGLRGGGWQGEMADLLAVDIAGGPLAAAEKAAELLLRAFAIPEADR